MADSIVSLLLIFAIVSGWAMGWIFLLRQRGNKKANIQGGLLFLFFSLCVLDNLLAHAGVFHPYQEKYFVPIWYTLSIGPTLFFFIKFTLYPAYEIRGSDAKHFLLPLAQAVFYWTLFFSGPDTQQSIWENFLEPFYKTFEGIGYVVLLFIYIALSYRYVKYKQAVARRKGHFWEYSKSIWLQWTLKVLFILAIVNTSYIVMDFAVYNFLGWNLYSVKGFSYLGDLSFAAMLLWLAGRAFQYVFGRAYPTTGQLSNFSGENDWTQVSQNEQRLFNWFEYDEIHRDPEVDLRRLAFLSGMQPKQARAIILKKEGSSFEKFLLRQRLNDFQDQRKDPKFRNQSSRVLALRAGFSSYAFLKKVLAKNPTVSA